MSDSITCPRCGMTSHHPRDVLEGYCGNCHDWTSGWTNMVHNAAGLIDCPDHGVQRLVLAAFDGCRDCEVCIVTEYGDEPMEPGSLRPVPGSEASYHEPPEKVVPPPSHS